MVAIPSPDSLTVCVPLPEVALSLMVTVPAFGVELAVVGVKVTPMVQEPPGAIVPVQPWLERAKFPV